MEQLKVCWKDRNQSCILTDLTSEVVCQKSEKEFKVKRMDIRKRECSVGGRFREK